MRLPSRIPTTKQLKALESAWIETCQSEWGVVLMELAGHRAAAVAMSMWQHSGGPVAIFCGSGNNGGDGLVVARYLQFFGIPIIVHMIEGSKQSHESKTNKNILEKLGVPVNIIGAEESPRVTQTLATTTLIIDALLGTGLDRPVEGIYWSVINAINKCAAPVLAIDVPSGVNSDTGQVMGCAVQAQATVTFGYLKAGLVSHPGSDLCGDLYLADIGLPNFDQQGTAQDPKPHWFFSTAERVRSTLPLRMDDAHKGDFGHLLTVAGSLGMSGASLLASKSALRAGAGLSILATAKSLVPELPAQEVIYRAIEESDAGSISYKALKDLEAELERASAVVLGPGLSLNPDTVKFVQQFIKSIKRPCVIDADALNAISLDTTVFPKEARNFVLTPHPKELARLMDVETSDIQADRLKAAEDAARRFGCTVVLKGSRTVIADADQQLFINPTGNSGMATAGSGDVLSGTIGGLLAQGMKPFDAAVAGVYLHGAAGDLAASLIGEAGIVAGDIMDHIPAVMSKLRSGEYQGSPLEVQLLGHQG